MRTIDHQGRQAPFIFQCRMKADTILALCDHLHDSNEDECGLPGRSAKNALHSAMDAVSAHEVVTACVQILEPRDVDSVGAAPSLHRRIEAGCSPSESDGRMVHQVAAED